jgi:hypothetical protein
MKVIFTFSTWNGVQVCSADTEEAGLSFFPEYPIENFRSGKNWAAGTVKRTIFYWSLETGLKQTEESDLLVRVNDKDWMRVFPDPLGHGERLWILEYSGGEYSFEPGQQGRLEDTGRIPFHFTWLFRGYVSACKNIVCRFNEHTLVKATRPNSPGLKNFFYFVLPGAKGESFEEQCQAGEVLFFKDEGLARSSFFRHVARSLKKLPKGAAKLIGSRVRVPKGCYEDLLGHVFGDLVVRSIRTDGTTRLEVPTHTGGCAQQVVLPFSQLKSLDRI